MASTDLKVEEGFIIPITIKDEDNKPIVTRPNNKLVENNIKAIKCRSKPNVKPVARIKPAENKPLLMKTDNNQNARNIKPAPPAITILSPLPNHSMVSSTNMGSMANKKSVKILPKPSLGFSIGNIVTNLTTHNGPGGASTYFIVTNLPAATMSTVTSNNIQLVGNNDAASVKHKDRYECSECDMSFPHKGSLSDHTRQEHKRKDVFQCEFCDKEFRRKHLLLSHVKSRHDEINHQKCSKCDEEFQSAKLLNSHMEKEHKEKYYTCAECGLEFNLRNTLMNHIKSVHRKEKAFQCDQCDARYSWKKSLNLHIDSTHKNLPQYKCNQCTSIFRWKTSLVHHLKAAHKTEEVSKHLCADCTLSFNSERKLNLHRKKIHKDKFAVPRLRKNRGRYIQHNKKEDSNSSSDMDSSEEEIPNPPHIDHMEIVDPSEKYTLPDVSISNGSPTISTNSNVTNPINHNNINEFNLPLPSHTNSSPIQPSNVTDQPAIQNNFNPSSLASTTPYTSYNPYFSWK